jgi:hypothetical protein
MCDLHQYGASHEEYSETHSLRSVTGLSVLSRLLRFGVSGGMRPQGALEQSNRLT